MTATAEKLATDEDLFDLPDNLGSPVSHFEAAVQRGMSSSAAYRYSRPMPAPRHFRI
jgi:hypothetical protein